MNTKKNTTAKAEENTNKENEEMVRVAFHLSRAEIKKLCHLRHEPKPGTAAAQVVRIALDPLRPDPLRPEGPCGKTGEPLRTEETER